MEFFNNLLERDRLTMDANTLHDFTGKSVVLYITGREDSVAEVIHYPRFELRGVGCFWSARFRKRCH